VIFWGAGATAELGIRPTEAQGRFLLRITDDKTDRDTAHRVARALEPNTSHEWHAALTDLLTILGDGNLAYQGIGNITDAQLTAMRRNWGENPNDEELRKRVIDLRLLYDWPALKAVARLCPRTETGTSRLNDLFNMLDMHIPFGSGFRAPVPSVEEDRDVYRFMEVRRLVGAKQALQMILTALFYIDYESCIATKQDELRIYYEVALLLGQRMQDHAVRLAQEHPLDHREFYQGDVTIVSLNYDPVALWVQFLANRELNHSPAVPHLGCPAVPLQLFHDFGHLIPARRIGRADATWPWYPLNEGAAQRLNEGAPACAVRLTKFLLPHGCLCWRECPDCGKLSAYHGDRWSLEAHGLFPPPPLRAFDRRPCPDWIPDRERREREEGKVDARQCLHCGTITYAHHTQTVMQSSFKPQPPSFIEEIQRDLRASAMQADHVILLGYSMPPDDVTYRAFFAARRQKTGDDAVRCTVVNFDKEHPGWYGPTDLKSITLHHTSPVHAAFEVFGRDNVRYYGGGVPNVFLENGTPTAARLTKLLAWNA
jgi:hypothetical protein